MQGALSIDIKSAHKRAWSNPPNKGYLASAPKIWMAPILCTFIGHVHSVLYLPSTGGVGWDRGYFISFSS